jgi:hypothetical protein
MGEEATVDYLMNEGFGTSREIGRDDRQVPQTLVVGKRSQIYVAWINCTSYAVPPRGFESRLNRRDPYFLFNPQTGGAFPRKCSDKAYFYKILAKRSIFAKPNHILI